MTGRYPHARSCDLLDAARYPDWLGEARGTLVPVLRAAEPDRPMWTWGADRHTGFWSRASRCPATATCSTSGWPTRRSDAAAPDPLAFLG